MVARLFSRGTLSRSLRRASQNGLIPLRFGPDFTILSPLHEPSPIKCPVAVICGPETDLGRLGVEPRIDSPCILVICPKCGAESGAIGDGAGGLSALVASWPMLSTEVRNELFTVLGRAPPKPVGIVLAVNRVAAEAPSICIPACLGHRVRALRRARFQAIPGPRGVRSRGVCRGEINILTVLFAALPLALGEPIKQPFDDVASENELKVVALAARQLQEPVPHRRGQIFGPILAHTTDSRYGRMTFPIRRAWAAWCSCSIVTFFCRQQSRRASSATSRPTLLR